MGLRWLCTLPGMKAKQDSWFCQESQTIRAKMHLGVHLAPPPYANSCKKAEAWRGDGDLLSVTRARMRAQVSHSHVRMSSSLLMRLSRATQCLSPWVGARGA